MANTELFRKIHEIISTQPRKFCMSFWEDPTDCGTTRCVAGWAVHLTTGEPLYANNETFSIDHHPAVIRLAGRLGVPDDFDYIGSELLEIEFDLGERLFHCGNSVAAHAVELFAEGRDEEAADYLNSPDRWRD
jgi:hypothetical protein